MQFEMNAQGSLPEQQVELENDMQAKGIAGRNHENIFIERPLAANPEIHPVNGKHAPDDEDDDDDVEEDLILGDEELAGDEEEFDVELDDEDIDEDDIDEDDLVIGTDDPDDEEEDDDL